ncbi:hypothetical protein BC628DRAFT_1423369 [Trametes gibbosa]|nr:hypothetical protein BC628DRAFT_1423369 [Trametes gibbosa]
MAATTRSFIVFKDEPEDLPTQKVERKVNQTSTSATYVLAPPPGPQLVYAPDKENIDPSTGTRASAEHSSGKKRKTALSVKAQASSPTKRLRPLAEKATKKPAPKARDSNKKTKRTTSKRTPSIRLHREPSLPRVTEETETADQTIIDSKCKELTVTPLADISEAYDVDPKEDAAAKGEAATSKEIVSEAGLTQVTVIRAAKDEPERPSTPMPADAERPSSPAPPASAASVFSTPERKHIYSAFTFTSPSPAAKRYVSTRGASVDRFSDAAL